MKNSLFTLLALLLLLISGVLSAEAAESRPRFTWNTFHFFWNKQAVPGAEIKLYEQQGGDYVVAFGPATSLTVRMDNDIVREVEARFVYTGAPDVSGRAFLRLQDSILRVGTYRWPNSVREKVEEMFREMSPQPQNYQASTSRFERRLESGSVWTMTLRFVDEE